MQAVQTNEPVFRITALWAFSECALGGVMHALKLPFTGFFVGGFAVLCIGLLAHVSQRNAAVILRSTLLVILVKAIVSPQSPPTAYLAVGFQGLSGALILGYLRPFAVAAYLFGFLALLESALQKILVLLLFFGKPLFEAIDVFFQSVLKNFGLNNQVSWANVVVCGYIGLYSVWGLVLGHWILRLPKQLDQKRAEYSAIEFSDQQVEGDLSPKKMRLWLFPLLVLIFVTGVFVFAGGKAVGGQRALYAVLRSVAVLLAWFYWARPLVMWAFQRWAKMKSESEKRTLAHIMATIPSLRLKAHSVYNHVSQKHRGWKRWREFVVALFVVATHPEP